MKVNLVKRQTIEDYAAAHAGSSVSFGIWLSTLKYVDWNVPGDINDTYGSADLLLNGSSRVVFNIAGNSYRMICKYMFGSKQVHLYVRWIGTHAAYTKLCNSGRQYAV